VKNEHQIALAMSCFVICEAQVMLITGW